MIKSCNLLSPNAILSAEFMDELIILLILIFKLFYVV